MCCFVFRTFATKPTFGKVRMIEGREVSFSVPEKNYILEVPVS